MKAPLLLNQREEAQAHTRLLLPGVSPALTENEKESETTSISKIVGSRRYFQGRTFARSDSKGALSETRDPVEVLTPQSQRVIQLSLAINFFLFLAKLLGYIESRSLALLASWFDSLIDLLGQGVLSYSESQSGVKQANYPAGKSRLEPLGVMVCAILMSMASIEVIRDSCEKIYYGLSPTSMDNSIAIMLVFVVTLKIILWKYSDNVAKKTGSSAVQAIAQDNANDVLSNIVALLAAKIASISLAPSSSGAWYLWMVDPVGAILISFYIVYSWISMGKEQVDMLVGKRADENFVKAIEEIADTYREVMLLDKLTAYYFGPKFLVELEMVMPEDTLLRDSHDAGIRLQHSVEKLELVERCFVHIDYSRRENDDHDPDVPLYLKTYTGTPKNSTNFPSLSLLEGVSESTIEQPSGLLSEKDLRSLADTQGLDRV